MKLLIRGSLIATALTVMAGCAGPKNIPVTIQSDPLGAYVTYQVRSQHDGSTDWIFLGKTPFNIKREVSNEHLKRAEAFRFRVMKEGYVDQIRDYNGREILEQIDEKGKLFWNPKMVPNN